MGRHSTLHLHDKIMGGRLKPLLREWRADPNPVTFDEIAARLRREHGIAANRETVRRWVKEVHAEDAEPDRAAS